MDKQLLVHGIILLSFDLSRSPLVEAPDRD